MQGIEIDTLFARLHPHLRQTMEKAAGLCTLRGNARLEPVHWLQETLQQQDSDVLRIARHFGLDETRLTGDVTTACDRLPRGVTAVSGFAPDLVEALQEAWVFASLGLNQLRIRGGHLLYAYLVAEQRFKFLAISPEIARIEVDALRQKFAEITRGSPEATLPKDAKATSGTSLGADGGTAARGGAPAALGRADEEDVLGRFTVDLNARAQAGEIDRILGRDAEIRQMIDILMRRRQNNPILVGEAGVGKTAAVEGFVHRLLAGEVPPELRDVRVLALDVGLLQAGASMRGEFEQRLRSVIDAVQAATPSVILFIDEVHTLIGAGGSAGTGDAANLLKPALARGTLRTIAATTWDEYRKYIERDPALSRRFQAVQIDEPLDQRCVKMLRAVVDPFEKHHQVEILDEALAEAVHLSQRFIPARQLPDKAVALLDTACARVALSQKAEPAQLDDCRHRIRDLRDEISFLDREQAAGQDHSQRLATLAESLTREETLEKDLEERWNQEKALVDSLLQIRASLRGGKAESGSPDREAAASDAAKPTADPGELGNLARQLVTLQGEEGLVYPAVDAQVVARIVSEWTGIPMGRMVRDEIQQVLSLADRLEQRVVGQRHALDLVSSRIQTNKAKLANPNRPVGVFMLVGPSGTGKTETALALAESLYGGEKNLVVINMSEFQEKHTVSTLKGSPPGYVGYDRGGVLTEAVRRRPYCVVLLDEVEKAHRDVHEIFFQVFDKGWMADADGRFIDFKNTIIILTTNAAQEVIIKMCGDPDLPPKPDLLEKALREPLTGVFPDALLNRLVVVPYYPITPPLLDRIIRMNLQRLEQRVRDNHNLSFTYTDALPAWIAEQCRQLERGARVVDALITNRLLPVIGREYLSRLASEGPIERVHLDVQDGEPVLHLDGESGQPVPAPPSEDPPATP
ncbi:MAG: type VI secretion system ATPase TssH [Verrucomicrobiales bacterium]|nr:type VI secretion system ATPase TssH [Verrucomicrobiales bacterium]